MLGESLKLSAKSVKSDYNEIVIVTELILCMREFDIAMFVISRLHFDIAIGGNSL